MSLLMLVASQTLHQPKNPISCCILVTSPLAQYHHLVIPQQSKHESRRPLQFPPEGWPMPEPFSGSYILCLHS
jgi:hypothetical protein